MLTRSRWRTSTATSPMPTRLYHKGKTRGGGGIPFHKHDRQPRTPPPDRHTKGNACTRPAFIAAYMQENLPTPYFDVPALLHQANDAGDISMFTKLGRILILDRQELTPASGSFLFASRTSSTSRTLVLLGSNTCTPQKWRCSR